MPAQAEIDTTRYHGWTGRLRPAWFSIWPIARTGLRLVFRRKLFWLLLALGLVNFFFLFATIYLKAQVSAENPAMSRFLDRILSSVTGAGNTYRDFMFRQSYITMLILALAGETLVGNDYRHGSLTFYMARRIERWQYIVGKLLCIGLLVEMTTAFPALLLYVEYGALTDSMTYFRENSQILWGIIGYGLVMGVALGLLLFAAAAWLQQTVPLVMGWTCIFVLLAPISEMLRYAYDDPYWLLLYFWGDIRLLGAWCFGAVDSEPDKQLLPWAAAIVSTVCVASALAIIPRLRNIKAIT
jgi:ABC-2 type transport system permease protein